MRSGCDTEMFKIEGVEGKTFLVVNDFILMKM
jgi:hypothetical protein